jgi:hypothetical protein
MDINWVDAYCYCHCMPRVTPAFSEREREMKSKLGKP